MTFWLIAAALSALAVVVLLWPLLRRRTEVAPRQAYDLGVYRDQLAEVAREAAEGTLGPEQAAAARAEIERRLLAAAETGDDGTPPARSGRAATWTLAAVLGVAVPAVAIGGYLLLGAPGVPSRPFAERPPPEAPPAQDAMAQEMGALAERLAKRLAEAPDNRDGWLLLGRSYAEMGRFDKAAEAFRTAIAHGFDDAETQGALGEVLAAETGGRVGPDARRAFAAALEHDPDDPRARYYAGLALAQDDRLAEAMEQWLDLLKDAPVEAPWRPVVVQQVQEAAASLGVEPPEIPMAAELPSAGMAQGDMQRAPSAGAAPGGMGPGPSAADVEAAGEMSAEERNAFIRSMVARLAARLEAEPGDFQGWLRLARAYGVLGEIDQARAALSRAGEAIRDLPEDAPERAQLEAARNGLPSAP